MGKARQSQAGKEAGGRAILQGRWKEGRPWTKTWQRSREAMETDSPCLRKEQECERAEVVLGWVGIERAVSI